MYRLPFQIEAVYVAKSTLCKAPNSTTVLLRIFLVPHGELWLFFPYQCYRPGYPETRPLSGKLLLAASHPCVPV